MAEERLPLLTLILAVLSLVSIGGGPKLMAPFAHEFVRVHHWMDGATLASLYGLTRGIPGLGGMILLVGFVGWTIAGMAGSIVAPLALLLPSSLLCFAVAPFWQARPGAPWKTLAQRTIRPVAVGQGFLGGIAVLHIAQGGHAGLAVAAAAFCARLAGMQTLAVLGLGGVLFTALQAMPGVTL